jgi:hypothetical protein
VTVLGLYRSLALPCFRQFAVHSSRFTVRRSWFTVDSSQFAVRCSLFAARKGCAVIKRWHSWPTHGAAQIRRDPPKELAIPSARRDPPPLRFGAACSTSLPRLAVGRDVGFAKSGFRPTDQSPITNHFSPFTFHFSLFTFHPIRRAFSLLRAGSSLLTPSTRLTLAQGRPLTSHLPRSWVQPPVWLTRYRSSDRRAAG